MAAVWSHNGSDSEERSESRCDGSIVLFRQVRLNKAGLVRIGRSSKTEDEFGVSLEVVEHCSRIRPIYLPARDLHTSSAHSIHIETSAHTREESWRFIQIHHHLLDCYDYVHSREMQSSYVEVGQICSVPAETG